MSLVAGMTARWNSSLKENKYFFCMFLLFLHLSDGFRKVEKK